MSRKLSRKRLPERSYGFAAAPLAGKVCVRSIHAVEIWDILEDVMVGKHPVPFGPPSVALSSGGSQVFFGGTSEILSASLTGEVTNSFPIESASLRCLAMQPDGRALIAGCSDGSIRIFDLS